MTTEEPLVGEMPANEHELAVHPRGKSGKYIPPSRTPFDTKGFNGYKAQPLDSKRETLRQKWLNVSYLVLDRAEPMARTLAKKDFGRMVQLLMSAGIAYDKVFPKVDAVANVNAVFNLFAGLPSSRVCNVVGRSPVPSNAVPSNTDSIPTVGSSPVPSNTDSIPTDSIPTDSNNT